MTPGLKFSTRTSARRTMRSTAARPSGRLRSTAIRALVVVDADERGRHLASAEAGEVEHPARDVTARGRLDLDDLRPEQPELVGRDRPGHDLGEVDDPDPFERLAHRIGTQKVSTQGRTSTSQVHALRCWR